MHIFHITDQATWQKVKHSTLYEGDTLSSYGFIHCCLSEQIDGVLKNWFKGKHDLVIVEIDPEKLISPVEYENLESGKETFPHVYGPINLDAVVNEELITGGNHT